MRKFVFGSKGFEFFHNHGIPRHETRESAGKAFDRMGRIERCDLEPKTDEGLFTASILEDDGDSGTRHVWKRVVSMGAE